MIEDKERSALGDQFDRTFASLTGRPDVAMTQPSPIRTVHPVLETPQSYIVQSARERDGGDWVFLEYIGKEGSVRMVLPPAVTERIARQAVALTSKNRKAAAKEQAQKRKAAGIKPAFLNSKKKGGKKKA